MSLPKLATEKRVVTYAALLLVMVAGIASFFSLGQLEDPQFTIKTAVVTTRYPGASPAEVELEVTDVIERAVQEMPELDYVRSLNRAGVSTVIVEIKPSYWSDALPQVWDVLRKKVKDIEHLLPPGASTPIVSDDFGDVYGFVIAVTGDGFSLLELDDYAKIIKKELGLVPGVARCEVWGSPRRVVYADVSQAQLSQLGISAEMIGATLRRQNLVVDAGAIDVNDRRLRVEPAGVFTSPEQIAELTIHGDVVPPGSSANAATGSASHTNLTQRTDLIQLKDIATITATYERPPMSWMRYNGQEPALAIYLSPLPGTNVTEVGDRIEQRLADVMGELPVGIETNKIAWQADLVRESIDSFMVNLLESVLIVLIVLWVSMGLRMAIIIGLGGLVMTIIATFMVMDIWGIDLQRMSLGALIVAMGMMVDNAIVVADGIVTRMQKGMGRVDAAIEAASRPAMPLLGATVIATMAFYPIFAAKGNSGEYCRTLFQVVGVSLMLSWLLAMTVVPLMCIVMLPTPKQRNGDGVYDGRFYRVFRGILGKAVRFKWPVMMTLGVLLGGAVFGFKYVNQMFFPDSSRPQLMIDYWAPQGTRVETVMDDLRPIEEKLTNHELVRSVSTFVGQGPPRFYLPVEPEKPYPEYAQLIVNFDSHTDAFAVADEIEPWLNKHCPQAMTRVRKYGVGPSDTWKLEALFSGPANADLAVLRDLAEQGMAILEACPLAREVRTNMRQPVPKIVPQYDQARGRWAMISRDDIGRATRRAFDGVTVGLYRERDDLYPIVLRHVEEERRTAAGALDTLQVQPVMSATNVPLSQVTNGIELEWEDPIIRRWNRHRSVRVQCSPIDGCTFPTLHSAVIDQFNAIELPLGYTLEWQGEYDSTSTAQASLIPGIVPAAMIMILTIVLLFNAVRPPLVILCTIPFAMIGVTLGFLVTREAFGFLALLGLMSLAGMMIKNAIVLLDEVDVNLAAGKSRYDALVQAAVSRLRPVFNAAATTVLAVIPLLQDPFWVAMAVTIMFGLAFGTVLTMAVVPVLYACFFGVRTVPPS